MKRLACSSSPRNPSATQWRYQVSVYRLFIEPERLAQEIEHAQIVERVHIRRDAERHRADLRAIHGSRREQRRIRIALLQVLDDGERLGEDRSLIFERREQPCGFSCRYSGVLWAPCLRCNDSGSYGTPFRFSAIRTRKAAVLR